MKKLKLNLLNLEGAAVLTRQQLKMVMGGSGDDGDGEVGSGDVKCATFVCVTNKDCKDAKCGDTCSSNQNGNFCWYNPFG